MIKRKKLVVLTGAGISAESGLGTFRDNDGLWNNYRIEDVATPEAWQRNPEMVQDFYNMRRKDCMAAKPNKAHSVLAELEVEYDVQIVTQNIDDLHERAGSTKVLHLHGEIMKFRSSKDYNLTYPADSWELKMGKLCEKGSQLRPDVVWFGEAVPKMETAALMVSRADVFVVIGTSLQVYPAASLTDYVNYDALKYIIDPNDIYIGGNDFKHIKSNATKGAGELLRLLIV